CLYYCLPKRHSPAAWIGRMSVFIRNSRPPRATLFPTRRSSDLNVQLKHADGGFGWPEMGPYDGILSTAAPRAVPEELLAQLAPNGVLVIPVGGQERELHLIMRDGDTEKFVTQKLEPVKFVPLLSGTTR